MNPGADVVRYWRHPVVDGVELMHARYRQHAFAPHIHDTYAIGVVYDGVEELRIGSTTEMIGVGGTVVLDPEVVHTGSVAADRWSYRVLYPSVEVVDDALAEWGRRHGTSSALARVRYDRAAGAAVLAAHRAAESGDRLAASSTLHTMFGVLWRKEHDTAAADRPGECRNSGNSRMLAAATGMLLDRLAEPPSLAELAGAVGVSRFALLRAFRAKHGLPPYAYLNQHRVRRARVMIARGEPLAEVAVSVGFIDQAHLSRHFRRTVGVTPGEYRRATTYKNGAARSG